MNSKRDNNRITMGLAVNESDTDVVLPILIDSITDRVLVDVALGSSPTVTSATRDKRDEDRKATYYGVSYIDGKTLVPIRTDSDGNLLATF